MKTLALLPNCSDHEHRDWYIGPVGHSRDSSLLEECNWDSMIASYTAADPDGNDHEILRFGHFAVGWIEEVAYRPGSKVAEVAETIREQLESYCVLDEEALSESEHEAMDECWESYGRSEFMEEFPSVLDTLDPCFAHDDDSFGHSVIDEIWHMGANCLKGLPGGCDYTVDESGSTTFYTGEWCSAACELLDSDDLPGRVTLHARLMEFAEACRIPGSDSE